MLRDDLTRTTIDLDERDKECISRIQKYMIQELKPIYTVSRKTAICWAIRKVAEDLEKWQQKA